jgi:hypothetical protein
VKYRQVSLGGLDGATRLGQEELERLSSALDAVGAADDGPI